MRGRGARRAHAGRDTITEESGVKIKVKNLKPQTVVREFEPNFAVFYGDMSGVLATFRSVNDAQSFATEYATGYYGIGPLRVFDTKTGEEVGSQ
jgi:hypothetical protein